MSLIMNEIIETYLEQNIKKMLLLVSIWKPQIIFLQNSCCLSGSRNGSK